MNIRPVSQRMCLCAVILTLIIVAAPLGLSASDDDGRGFDHVFIIMMENTGYDTLIGNPNAPFIQLRGGNHRPCVELLRRGASEPAQLYRSDIGRAQRRGR